MNSLNSIATLTIAGKRYRYHSLKALEEAGVANLKRLPYSIKILLENLLRHEDGETVTREDIETLARWGTAGGKDREIFFMPSRVLLQDFTGVPAVADLAAMRSALKKLGGDPKRINPYTPADLVIDHSVQVDSYGSAAAFNVNAAYEMQRNKERYQFLRWGQNAFNNFRVVPPDSGIVHQVNLEHLASVVMTMEHDGATWAYPDSLIGTDSHSTMINGLGVVGWGVGGIEAEAALLSQPSTLLIPQVVGFKLTGALPTGCTATDLVLAITEKLRKHGVVGKFVEFFGPALETLSLADRATIANMAPEYGATMGLFPVDDRTIDYLRLTGRDNVAPLVEAYFRAQGLWYTATAREPNYSERLEFNLDTVEPSMAGPSRPQDRVPLGAVRNSFRQMLLDQLKDKTDGIDPASVHNWLGEGGRPAQHPPEFAAKHPDEALDELGKTVPVRQPDGVAYNLCHGSVVIAAITSCTNTSNPSVMIAAGLLARNAIQRGLQVMPWVKTSLAPGSRVVTDYLRSAGLMPYLEGLRFHLVGYGCTTCIGNSGPLREHISEAIKNGSLAVASVLSGNRNFEGRVNAQVRANYLASPPLVVAYALAGNINIDLTTDPLGTDPAGEFVYLKDIWPTQDEINTIIGSCVLPEQYRHTYDDIFKGDQAWNQLKVPTGELYQWDKDSTYIKEPPFFADMTAQPAPLRDIESARVLALLGDSVTTDHISPAGSISRNSPAGRYLISQGVERKDFNSYGARRGNHEVMARGTFANVRLRNQLVPGVEGGETLFIPANTQMSIYDAAMKYRDEGIPLIILAGKEYGTGSSRDWAAKGPKLLGVRAVIAESFERIHRSNLVGMGILPLQYQGGENAQSIGLNGRETFTITGIGKLSPRQELQVTAKNGGKEKRFNVTARIDTPNEMKYFLNDGILPYVLRQTLSTP